MRVLLVIDSAAPLAPTIAAARRVAPSPAHLHVLVLEPEAPHARFAGPALEGLFAVLGPGSVEAAYELAQVPAVARDHDVSLVVLGPMPSRSPRSRALCLVELSSLTGCDVLSVGERCDAARPSTGTVALALHPATALLAPTAEVLRGLPGVRSVEVFARQASVDEVEALEPSLRALLPGLGLRLHLRGDELEALEHEALDLGAEVLLLAATEVSLVREAVTGLAHARALEEAAVPLLVVHRASAPALVDRLDASDTLRLPGRARCPVTVERSSVLGRAPLGEDETLLVAGAEARGPLRHRHGVVEVPAAHLGPGQRSLALESGGQAAVAQVAQPGPLVLVDAAFPLAALPLVEPLAATHTCVVVRLRRTETLRELRARFGAASPWGANLLVLDATAWLDDAGASDVPEAVDGLRLQRLALRLVADGADVGALVVPDERVLRGEVFPVWSPRALQVRSPLQPLTRPAPRLADDEARWTWLTGAPLTPGHDVDLVLDNGAARLRLLSLLATARERVHWQCYLVEDDEVARAFADALVAAAARGCGVRVLVDALYSRHEAYGVKHPLLERLAATPGVEVRSLGRLEGVPSVVALKQRNHRKLVVVDGAVAVVTGRNIGVPYYRGFSEGAFTPQSLYHEVPWQDAGAVLRGPLVARADEAFLEDWRSAGGAPFAVRPAAPQGPLACRLVLHRGLRDASTFEALRELVESARERLVLMNTFPLVLELQRALLGAVQRGVRVQFLFGNVRPRWGDEQAFVGGAYRELADELVRSRLDPVLRAGAEGWEFALPHPTLAQLLPHVHAKLYLRDDDLVAVGSANLDVTSAYWESEALLLVHDRAFATRALAAVEALLGTSRRVDVESGPWAETEARRHWLSRTWPTLVG